MTFLTFVSSGVANDHVTIDFNDLAGLGAFFWKQMNPRKSDVIDIRIQAQENYVEIVLTEGRQYQVSVPATSGDVYAPVTSVEGVVPTDNEELFALLKTMVGI